jgi:hypothetical protein
MAADEERARPERHRDQRHERQNLDAPPAHVFPGRDGRAINHYTDGTRTQA